MKHLYVTLFIVLILCSSCKEDSNPGVVQRALQKRSFLLKLEIHGYTKR